MTAVICGFYGASQDSWDSSTIKVATIN